MKCAVLSLMVCAAGCAVSGGPGAPAPVAPKIVEDSYVAVDINNSGQIVGGLERNTYRLGRSGISPIFEIDTWAMRWTPREGWTDLGSLGPETGASEARAINETGDVVGESYPGHDGRHAFLLMHSGEMKDLGTLGGAWSRANAISDAGHVVGESRTDASGEVHAFLWTADSGMRDLGTLGGDESVAYSVNSDGVVVGKSKTTTGDTHAFAWTADSGMVDLGILCGTSSEATAINDPGQVVGFARSPDQDVHAVIWETDGSVTDLGTFDGEQSYGRDINESGDVVGWRVIAGVNHAFLWSATRGMVDLGTPGRSFSVAYAINDSGQVVGISETSAGPGQAYIVNQASGTGMSHHAFVWSEESGMTDLGAWAGGQGGPGPSAGCGR